MKILDLSVPVDMYSPQKTHDLSFTYKYTKARVKNPEFLFRRRPGLVLDAAEWLVEKRVKAVGIDLMASQHPKYSFFPSKVALEETGDMGHEPNHELLLGHDIVIVEHLRNIDKLVGKRVKVSFFLCSCAAWTARPSGLWPISKNRPGEVRGLASPSGGRGPLGTRRAA